MGLVILGSVVLYQQSEISALTGRISSQSLELAHPTAVLKIAYTAVIKANATSRPLLFIGLRNVGQAPVSEGVIQINVFGSNDSIKTCTHDLNMSLPLLSNESTLAYFPLACGGELGDRVFLNVGVGFLTYGGLVSMSSIANTTIGLPELIVPNKATVRGISLQSWVEPSWFGQQTSYEWGLKLTNGSPAPIVGLNATLRAGGTVIGTTTNCVPGLSFPPPPRLDAGNACNSIDSTIEGAGPYPTGQYLDVFATVRFLNGTTTTIQTTAVVEPTYAFYFLSLS